MSTNGITKDAGLAEDKAVNNSDKEEAAKEVIDAPGIKVWRLVLTGGPCGGKTTAQNRLATFFESLGWRVFRVAETATILLNGGIGFASLTDEQRLEFQENLLKTMFQIEDTYFSLATTQNRNCLVICDTGVQLVGSSAFLGTQFRMVARFEDHFALNEMAVVPLGVTKLKIVFKPLYATSQSNYGSLRRHHCVEHLTPYHVVAGFGAITTQDNKL